MISTENCVICGKEINCYNVTSSCNSCFKRFKKWNKEGKFWEVKR